MKFGVYEKNGTDEKGMTIWELVKDFHSEKEAKDFAGHQRALMSLNKRNYYHSGYLVKEIKAAVIKLEAKARLSASLGHAKLQDIGEVDKEDWIEQVGKDGYKDLCKYEGQNVEVLCEATDNYYDIKLPNGKTLDAISGYHLRGYEGNTV